MGTARESEPRRGDPSVMTESNTEHEHAGRDPEQSRNEWNTDDSRGGGAMAGDWVQKIEAVHEASTTHPVVSGNHFAVGRSMDVTVRDLGRLRMDQIMLYEVRHGQIVLEQFFY
jgi:hypothetical protein